jgi:tagatose-1,6-bisphosphate aldolase
MRLPTLTSQNGRACILAFDQLPVLTEEIPQNEWLAKALKVLSPYTTGVLLDPVVGLSQVNHKAKGVGVMLSLTSELTENPETLPTFMDDWGVEEVSQNYGVAYLDLWYQPGEAQSLQKKQVVAELSDYCRQESIDFVVRLRQVEGSDNDGQLQALQEFRSQVSAFVLDFPANVLTAATITTELDVPWWVEVNQLEWSQAKEVIRQALESGAAGAILGSGLWTGLTIDSQLWQAQLEQEVRDRVIETRRIIDEYTAG